MADKNDENRLILENYYEIFDIPYNLSRKEIYEELEKRKAKASSKLEMLKIDTAIEYLVYRKKDYDNYLKNHGVKFPKTKGEKRRILIKTAIVSGLIVAIGIGASSGLDSYVKHNEESNVCVEYVVQQGDTLNELKEKYDFKDISFEHYEISGSQRQYASGSDVSSFLAAGDVIIGRTTKENADKLVAEKGATIITIEEAIDLLEQSGLNSFKGEFKKAAEGDSTFVFYVPSNEKTLG